LVKTGPLDHADWNYHPLLKYISRRRFSLAASFLPEKPVRRLLEIGYGSGIFLPFLSKHAELLYGVDIHPYNTKIEEILRQRQTIAHLYADNAAKLPFDDHFFDIIVAISTIEFIVNRPAAVLELTRVLSPQGKLVCVMPASSPLLDLALRAMTGQSATKDFGDGREKVLPALLQCFSVASTHHFPCSAFPIYSAYELTPLP